MKKNLLLGLFAAACMLLATSCSNDELDAVQSLNEAQVTFSLGLEGGIATRAISDGTGAKKLVYAVYKLDANGTPVLQKVEGSDNNGQFVNSNAFGTGLTQTETVILAKGQTYQVAFWAQNGGCSAYNTTDLANVQVNYTNASNNHEFRDAFFATKTFTVSGNEEINVTLNRPFAQINVGVTDTDWTAAEKSGITIQKSSVVIKNAANTINLLTGAVSGEEEVTYNLANIPAEPLKVDHNGDNDTDDDGESYKYLSMSYILVADGSANGSAKANLESLEFTFNPVSGENIILNNGLNNVPVQRNWRTNILGKLLTGDIEFNITIDKNYLGDNNIIPGEEAVVGTDALEIAMAANTSTEPFTYNVQGLSEVNDTEIDIPADFVSEEVTLNFTDIKNGSDLSINGANFANTVVLKVPTDVCIGTLNINLPNAHVIWAQGTYTTASVSTSGSTFVIAAGLKVGETIVNTGNISIEAEAEVKILTAGDDNEEPIIVYLDENAVMPEVKEGTTAIKAEETSTGVYTMDLTEDIVISKTMTLNQNTIINGNNKTLTYTGTDRAFQITSGTVVINDLTINLSENTPEGSRGINLYNGITNEAINVTLNNVTVNGYKAYAVNIGGGKDNKLTINNSRLTGFAAINVNQVSVNHTIVVNGSTLNGKNHNNNFHFGTVVVDGANAHSLTITNSTITKENLEGVDNKYYHVIVGVNCTYDVCDGIDVVVRNVVDDKGIYYIGIENDAVNKDVNLKLLADIELENIITIPSGKNVSLDLNGKTITGTDNTSKNFSIFDNRGNFTIKNTAASEGKITLTATINSGWDRYSAVVANNPGGNLTVGNGVVIEHLGGTDMAYGIDNLTNGKGTSAITTINGATIKSPYRAIRQFLNGVEATNELNVRSGIIEGANKSIWMQDPSKNANTGKLVVESAAQLKGDVYLSVTAGSTEWPVEASIAKAALVGDSKILTNNVPTGYELVKVNDIYSIRKYEIVSTVKDLQTALKSNAKNIYFAAPAGDLETIDLYTNTSGKKNLKIVGTEGTKIKFADLQVRAELFDELTIENCEILRMPNKTWGMIVFGSSNNATGVYTISNCTFNGQGSQGIYINEQASGATYNILNCTFDGNFGGEGAVTIQNNDNVNHTVNVKGCTFNNIPETSHKIYLHYAYNGWTLNTDLSSSDIYWKTSN